MSAKKGEKKKPAPIDAKTIILQKAAQEEKARAWLWLGVGGFTTIILIIWGWTFYNSITLISLEKTPEKKLVNDIGQSWEENIITKKQQEEKEKNATELKIILQKIKYAR